MIQIVKPSRATEPCTHHVKQLIELAKRRAGEGRAPPNEIYRVEFRRYIDWSEFPLWARPVDPELFDRCCHEG